MSLLWRLAFVFFKIGLLTVGGGLAMLPIIQHEMLARGWLDNQQFLNIYGIAQMTPGPITVNAATFVGYRVLGGVHPNSPWIAVAGALAATLSVCLPSLLCINLFGSFWMKHRDHPAMIRVFLILRPMVSGLVATAAILLCMNCLWGGESFRLLLQKTPGLFGTGILFVSFLLTAFAKVSPFYLLLGGMLIGILCGA